VSCPGLHCPGCSGGQSLAVLGAAVLGLAVAAEAVPWVAARIWWIGSTAAACFALAVAASVWLERWSDRRGTAWGAARGIVSRADVILPPPARVPAAFPAAGARPAIAPAPITVNIFGQPTAEQAAVIRQAITPALDSPYPRQPAG
jgi:hypothetical protein